MLRRGLSALKISYVHLNNASKHFYKTVPNKTSFTRRANEVKTISPQCEQHGKITDVLLGLSIMTLFGFEKNPIVEDDIVMNIKRSILLMERNECYKAEQILHLTLRLAQQTKNERAITYIYDVLANMALQQGEYAKAEKLFVSVMQRLLAAGTAEGDPKNVHISLKLARIYHNRGDMEKAAMGFKWSIDHLKAMENQPETTSDYLKLCAVAKDWYAHFLIDNKEYKEALVLLTETYDILNKFKEDSLEDIILCLNDMATVYDQLEDIDKAEELLLEATVLGKDIPKMESLGAIYVNLGRLYLKKKIFVKARKSCGFGWKLCHNKKNKECAEEAMDCLREVRKLEW